MKKAVLILSITLLGILLGSSVFGQVNNDVATTGRDRSRPVPKQFGQVNNDVITAESMNSGMAESSLLAASTSPVNLQLATGGKSIKSSVADSSARLKISSVITDATRTLSASVSAVPAGTSLKLQALTPNSNFDGTPGILLPATALPTTGTTNIITGIESCNSGLAADDGYLLKYTWELLNPTSKKREVNLTSTNVVVTLTISAAI